MNQFIAIGAIGLIVFLIGLFKLRRVRASRSWAETTGTIVESSIREDFSRGDEDSPDSWSYTPVVRYEYQVEGRTYSADRITFDRRAHQNRRDAEAVLARYPAGGQVAVRFDPRKPSDAVLRTVSGAAWVLSAVGAGIVILAALAAVR